jgi:hypothetical protein
MSIIQKGILDGNNERHKVPEQFMQLRQKQVENKAAVRLLFLNECGHLLPEDMWIMILSYMFTPEERIAYFTFKRYDQFYYNDWYVFAGTEEEWFKALVQMRSTVNPYDLQDDIPMDTYCSGICHTVMGACPDAQGHRCQCNWAHTVFETELEQWAQLPDMFSLGPVDVFPDCGLMSVHPPRP